mmetsp:Transcript_24157/g.43522  ORF Transcript_24157/g.43522 Transcript_24157/m.43522 type:complete len:177 (+) Transcript_24157:250-780(+)
MCTECKGGLKGSVTFGEEYESCGWRGKCIESEQLGMFEVVKKNYCECDPGFYGDSCQFEGPCTELGFQDDEFLGYGKRLSLLYDDDKNPLMFHGQPTYIIENPSSTDQYAVLLFDGGRWIVITFEFFCLWDDDTTVKTILDIPKIPKCLATFKPWRDDNAYDYISEYLVRYSLVLH